LAPFSFQVRTQLSKLWSPVCLRVFVSPLLKIVETLPEVPAPASLPVFYEPDDFPAEPLPTTSAASAGAAAKQATTFKGCSLKTSKFGRTTQNLSDDKN
jgi:hypothetical protein